MRQRDRAQVDPARIHGLAEGPETAGPVVYWMSRDQRAEDNWALLHARHEAVLRRAALGVVFCLVPSFLEASDRHYAFMLRGLAETAETLEAKGIPFFCLRGEPADALPSFLSRHGVALLVTDFDPLRIKQRWQSRVAGAVDCAFHEVDAHNIAPCRFVSRKSEFAARTIRPRIRRALPRFLVDLPPVIGHPHAWKRRDPASDWRKVLGEVATADRAGGGFVFRPGAKVARRCLDGFIREKLADYDAARNDPNRDGQSNLSPYLHFGQIAPQRVALEVRKSAPTPEAADVFLEELVVRRELADNFCLYNPHYDSAAGFADWAARTLREHAGDKRPYLYNFEQFESAETHDRLWNAAQMEMVKRGKMHGYLRMYWGKKILEWSASPEEAMETALRLNNAYELDGRDPNGYAGVAWCIGGAHDRAWPSHQVFGKIRYMNINGCRRKFDVDAYVSSVAGTG